MPAVNPGSKVLVSGANGFVATWIVRVLLERGFSVRGTVRSESKAVHLRKLFSAYGDKHEVVVVDDITKEGAFDEAVKDIDAIVHTASPCRLDENTTVNELVIPALKGTSTILQSALEHGPNVRRVVITSSFATVLTPGLSEPRVYTEVDWNEVSVQEVEEKGSEAAVSHKYRASKILAEKAAWDFVERNKSSIKWDLSVMIPAYVFGPPIQEITSLEQLNQSLTDLYNAVIKADVTMASLITGGTPWVDVRDLSLTHALALEKEAAGGERILVSAGSFLWQNLVLSANAISPPIYENLWKGNPAYDPKIHQPVLQCNPAKADKIFGIRYKTMDETVRDLLQDFKRRGW